MSLDSGAGVLDFAKGMRNEEIMIRQLDHNDNEAYFEVRLKGLQLNPEAFGTGAEDWSKATSEQFKLILDE